MRVMIELAGAEVSCSLDLFELAISTAGWVEDNAEARPTTPPRISPLPLEDRTSASTIKAFC